MVKKRKRRHRRSVRVQRMTTPGSSPGSVVVHPGAPQPVVRIMHYDRAIIKEEEVHELEQLRHYVASSGVTWVDVVGLGDARKVEKLGEIFDLHTLALEDVVNVHQRAKVEEYGDHLFIVARMMSWNDIMETEQISMFVGKNFVLTFQERQGDCLDPVRERLRKGRGRIRTSGSDYLVYALLDAVVDFYFPIVDEYGERLEHLDATILSECNPQLMEHIHEIRGDLMMLRRAIRPLRDELVMLMRDSHSLVSEETQLYFRDCYDHVVQILDSLDTYREMCGNLREFYLSAVSNRMNEVMKVLTIIATIFIPLSFIAGVYGMNFKMMPELDWALGYPLALTLMVAVATGLIGFFWRRGWLSGPAANGDVASSSQSNASRHQITDSLQNDVTIRPE